MNTANIPKRLIRSFLNHVEVALSITPQNGTSTRKLNALRLARRELAKINQALNKLNDNE